MDTLVYNFTSEKMYTVDHEELCRCYNINVVKLIMAHSRSAHSNVCKPQVL